MQTFSLINCNKTFRSALEHYKKNLDLSYNFKTFSREDSSNSMDALIVHNQIPEKIDGVKILLSLRTSPLFSNIPAILVTPELSEPVKELIQHLEFVTISHLPFDSGIFFNVLDETARFRADNIHMLDLRRKLEVDLAKKNFEEARNSHTQLSQCYNNQYVLAFKLANIEYNLENYEEALCSINEAIKFEKNSLEANNLKASILIKMGNKEEALKTIQNTKQQSEVQLANMLHWGDRYLSEGKADKAIDLYGTVLKEDPKNTEVKRSLLAAQILSGDSASVEKSLEDGPMAMEMARICNLKAITMVDTGNHSAAEVLYKNAISFLPNKDEAYKLLLNLGICMKKVEDYKKALEYFTMCKEQAPEDYDVIDKQLTHTTKLKQEKQSKKFINEKLRDKSKPKDLDYSQMD